MSVQIIKLKDQAKGQFDNGSILENKPIGFPGEGSMLRPYSNLFYWAHAWSDKGGLIDVHPHQVFEIMSFVLEGEIAHFDTKNSSWKTLKKGDVQIIRAGSGISHAERLFPGGQIFQIWFDPDITKSILKPASYDDYPSDVFPVFSKNGLSCKVYKGTNGPVVMDTEAIQIQEFTLDGGAHLIELEKEKIHSCYVLEGLIEFDKNTLEKKDYFVVNDKETLNIMSHNQSKIFIISSPVKLSYQTYYEKYGR
ncbi:pirin family protein [candidate division KSB1 bacterium]